MKICFTLFIVTALFSNCNSNNKSKQINITADTTLTITTGCYRTTIEKDTAELQLTINGNLVSGNLQYKRFEKDDNKGTFTGIIEHNTIKAWYSYQSEGKTSVKEVFFKIEKDKLAEGYGDVKMRNDSFVFMYPATLRYEDGHPYLKVNCN